MNPRGVLAELRAAAFLRRHGYRVRHLRWRGGGGEIDLVAEENGLTVFVEVKSSPRLGEGAQRVDRLKAGRLRKAALLLSSGSPNVYGGALYTYQHSFLEWLHLEDMGVFMAAGDENKSPELLERLRAAGAALTEPDEHNVARLVIRAGDVEVQASLNQTQAARDLMNRLPLTVSGVDSGVDYCCELKEGVFDEAEKQQGWTDGDVSVADGWFAILHSGQDQSQDYRVMVVAHLDDEANAQILALPQQVTFELSLDEPYAKTATPVNDGALS